MCSRRERERERENTPVGRRWVKGGGAPGSHKAREHAPTSMRMRCTCLSARAGHCRGSHMVMHKGERAMWTCGRPSIPLTGTHGINLANSWYTASMRQCYLS